MITTQNITQHVAEHLPLFTIIRHTYEAHVFSTTISTRPGEKLVTKIQLVFITVGTGTDISIATKAQAQAQTQAQAQAQTQAQAQE